MMRIAHVTATFPPYHGGTGNVCYHNARVLAARGHNVHVLTAAWPGEVADPTGVTVHRFRPLIRVGNAPVLPQLLRQRDFDVMHIHYPFYSGAEFVVATRVPYVVTYHQDVELDGVLGIVTRIHQRVIGRRLLKRARRLCPTTLDYFHHSTIADLHSELGDRVVELSNGVDTNRFVCGPLDLDMRRRHRVPDDAFVVLFVGAMDSAHFFKGVPTLIDAIRQVGGVYGLFAGDGDLRASYERLVREQSIEERVRFLGRVCDEDLARVYHAADVVALPSETRGEAFGMVLLEAMSSGRSVIATDLPGVRKVVSHGITGLVVPPASPASLAEAIDELARNAPQRAAMGRAGRATVEQQYDWERIGDRLESMYVDVACERAERRR